MAKAPRRLKLTNEASEDELHKSVRALLDVALLPPAFWSTFPSGMYELPKSAGGRLKAYGLKEGVPDILAIHGGRVVWLELKRLKGVISKAQQAMHGVLELAGAHVYVCRSPESVVHALYMESFPIRSGVITQFLTRPFLRAERQVTGDFYYGQVHKSAAQGEATQPAQSAS